MIGAIIVKIAFVASIFSVIGYWFNLRQPSAQILKYSRVFYRIAVAGVVSASGMLIYLLMTHQFQYSYVWNYSSIDLPLPLLFSTWYAGQEGSFMLWAFYTGIIGIFLMLYSDKKGYESELMIIYGAIFSFLLLMLIVKNPFKFIWETFPNELLHTGPIPAGLLNYQWIDQAKGLWGQFPSDGKGLNPLLQNYWMVIHPPILFIGFTSMSIPFAYAVAGMLKRDYVSWIRVATPWTVFGALALGTGIILGGYWAYETLGWGGYWGWDPVENSSLVPWLVCIASIHTMLSQRRSGAFIKTNFVLSMLCFVLVLYSTFLTRSGVLGETSVHSFVEAGMWVYWLLLGVIFLFVVIGFGLFFMRWKEMPVVPVEHSFVSREFALFLGASALVFASVFIVIGTSSPIITNIFKGKISAVDPSYYITTVLPLGIFIALLIGVAQLLWWKNSKREVLIQSLKAPIILSTLFVVGTYFMGAHHLSMILFLFVSAFAFFTNLIVGFNIIKGNPKMAGGAIAHIGIALMFIGFVGSAKYDTKETISLEQDKQVDAMGYKMKYVGYHPIERGRFAFNVEVEQEGKKFIIAPVMFQTADGSQLIRNPDIINLITKDFYLSPLSLEEPNNSLGEDITMYENQEIEKNNVKVKYLGRTFSQSPETGNINTVSLDVTYNGKKENLKPSMTMKRGEVNFIPVTITGTDISLVIKALPPGKQEATITLTNPKAVPVKKNETLVVEASVKPFINLVWLGTFSLIAGFIITIVRRAGEARQKIFVEE